MDPDLVDIQIIRPGIEKNTNIRTKNQQLQTISFKMLSCAMTFANRTLYKIAYFSHRTPLELISHMNSARQVCRSIRPAFFLRSCTIHFSITLARTHSAPGHSIENNNKYSSPVIIISTSSFAEAVKPPIKESYSNSFIRIDPAAASSRGVSSLFGEPFTGIW